LKTIPGLSIAVVKNDSIIFMESYGYSDYENKIKATIRTPYYIASTTKSFVGTLAQILEYEGIINLDESITNYKPLKEFNQNSIFQNITIKDLLTHTSGITNGYLVWRNGFSGQYTQKQLIEILETHTTSLSSKSFKYDNLGYNIFDLILQEELGLNWKTLLNEKVFSKLKMDHTTAFASIVNFEKWPIAKPYLAIGNDSLPTPIFTIKNDKTMQSAGGLYCSISDAANWLLFNINEGVFNAQQLYPKDIINKVHLPLVKVNSKGTIFNEKSYGLGWHKALYRDKDVFYHNGGFPGYSAKISFVKDYKVGVAIFVNESFFGDNLADILTILVYDYFFEKNSFKKEKYKEKISALNDKILKINESITVANLKKEKIKTNLTLSMSKYEGTFVNEGLGSITTKIIDDDILFKMGVLNSKSTFTMIKDEVEIEFTGPGSKNVVQFNIDDDEVYSLNFKGLTFMKIY
jgi:CubicO group peptidase (beta-lactamase class C family)